MNSPIDFAEQAKHRFFQFLGAEVLPDNKLVVITLDDAFFLGVLSSRIHVVYSIAAGGWIGYGNDPVYVKTDCFDPFPFPLCGGEDKGRIRELAEALDAHRKRVLIRHGITLTSLYNVLETIRANEQLSDKEKIIHDQGLVSVLKQLHDDLDAAVFAAYGWPATLTDPEILERLVALNAERAAEEARGVIHWLRPEYQIKSQESAHGRQKELALPEGKIKPAKTKPVRREGKAPWPKSLAERVRAVENALHAAGAPATAADLAKKFRHAKPAMVAEILKTLETLGRAHRTKDGKFRP
jgi:hypothetical protein